MKLHRRADRRNVARKDAETERFAYGPTTPSEVVAEERAFTATIAALQDDLAALRSEFLRSVADTARLTRDLGEAQADRAAYDAALRQWRVAVSAALACRDFDPADQITTDLGVAAAAVRQFGLDLDFVNETIVSLLADVQFKQGQLVAIAESHSWRITAPLRRVRSKRVPGRTSAPIEACTAENDGTVPGVHVAMRSSPIKPSLVEPFPAEAAKAFDESMYLDVHPDVRAVVEAGDQPSGLHHYLHHGRSEGRISAGFAPYFGRTCTIEGLTAQAPGITAIGPMSVMSGLGVAARGYAAAAAAAGVLVETRDVDVYNGAHASQEVAWAPVSTRGTLLVQNADILPTFFANHDIRCLDNSYVFALWFWEQRGFRNEWFASFGAVDEVWVPSAFCREAVETVSPVRVTVVPPVVGLGAPTKWLSRRQLGMKKHAYTFLYVFDASSYLARKNPETCVQAFKAAFGSRTDVQLILKYHSANREETGIRELRDAIAEAPNILLISRRMSDRESWSLKAACDCFVSPHRSEGFGLNVAEAMSLGKPVIATDFSGTKDFVNAENGYPLSYRLTAVGQDIGPYLEGSVWAEPDIDELVDVMRHLAADPGQGVTKGRIAARVIEEKFSIRAVASHIARRHEELGLMAPGSALVSQIAATHTIAERHPLAEISPADRVLVSALPQRPTISVVVPVYNVEARWLRNCIESVRSQRYPYWELCLCDDASTRPETIAVLDEYRGTDPRIRIARLATNSRIAEATNFALTMTSGSFVAFLDNDDELHPDALLHVAEAILTDPDIDLIYTDEDKLDEDGRHCDDYHKPDWSPELLESCMYLLHMMAVRKSLLLEAGGLREDYDGAQDYDLALRLSRMTNEIHHIPEILYHWRKIAGSAAATVDAKPYALDRACAALRDHVERKYGSDAEVVSGALPGLWRVRRRKSSRPPVTVLIPTNNVTVELPGRGAVNLIDNLITSIELATDYTGVQVVVVDNNNLSLQQKQAFTAAGHQVASYAGSQSPFNFADKANFAFSLAETDVVVLLNDDMEVFDDDWLGALMDHAVNPEVGVVGAKLISADGRIQHAGVLGGVNGGTAHAFYGLPENHVGYNGFTHATRNYSMVTGACMATRKEVIDAVRGFDLRLKISYNDVDFCLSALQAGYRNVYTPHAVIRHFESMSIPRSAADAHESKYFREKWRRSRFLTEDPFYNPNLSKFHVDFRRVHPL